MTIDQEAAAAIAALPAARIGQLLQARRKQVWLGRRDAADAAGVKVSEIDSIESGRRMVTQPVLVALLKRYGVPLGEFVPPRRALAMTSSDATNAKLLRQYVDDVRRWRATGHRAQLNFRHDDVLVLAETLGSNPEEIERGLIAITGCSRSEARLLRKWLLVEPATADVSHPPGALTASTTVQPLVGVLGASPLRAAASRAAGIGSVVLAVHWSSFAPTRGAIDAAYVSQIDAEISEFTAAGMRVILSPGFETPPNWVFALSSSPCFVDQHGTVWEGGPGEDVPDAVFDPAVRQAQQSYLLQLGQALADEPIYAVRAGGLLDGELRYPSAGLRNSYWAFSAGAQAQSPVPGWRPGDPGTVRASKFISWYLGSLTSYQNDLVTVTAQAFPTAKVMVLYPGWGVRPGQVAQAVAGCLDGNSPAELNGSLQAGLDFASQVSSLPDGTTVHSTNLSAPNRGSGPVGEAPIYYLASLAAERNLPLGGETAGEPTVASLSLAVERARALRLTDMLWMDESDLYSPAAGAATLAQLRSWGAVPDETSGPVAAGGDDGLNL